MDKIKFIDKKKTSLNEFYNSYTYMFQVYNKYELGKDIGEDIIDVISFVLSKEIKSNSYCKIMCVCFSYPHILAFIDYSDPLENFDRRLFTDNLGDIPVKLYEEREQQQIGDYLILILSNKHWSLTKDNILEYEKRTKIDVKFDKSSIYFVIGNMQLEGIDQLVVDGDI